MSEVDICARGKVTMPLVILLCGFLVQAQTASLQGLITDESGAVVPGATVLLTGKSKNTRAAQTGIDGMYSIANAPAGDYTVDASAPSLSLGRPIKLTLRAAQTLNLQLKVAATAQQLKVQDNATAALSTDASGNASALVLRGKDLDALGDDPDDLAADLAALAGPAAGPNGGAIFIDGFSGGQLPSKDSIREIRINQNPFSPEYDKLGFGRIEIFTKPGTDKFRGTMFYNFGDDFWNSRNPYAAVKAPFLLQEYGGNISGPLGAKASFFLDVQRHDIDNGAIVNGTTLDPASLQIIDPYTATPKIPQKRLSINPRADFQINPGNTLTARYVFSDADIKDSGVGGFNLLSRGYHAGNTSHTLQLSETVVLGASIVNETRFQLLRVDSSRIANDLSPAVNVLGAFNGGGAQVGRSFDNQTSYEFQNYTSIARGTHTVRFGVRLREEVLDSVSQQNFGGTFTFGGGGGVTSIERYRRTLLRASGGGATQFSINTGNPSINGSLFDAGLFSGDDWRARPNLTVSFGIRYEVQTNIGDKRGLAPRIGIAWAPGAGSGKSKPKSVIRAGFGMFYDRFALSNTITALRYNGVVQQPIVVANPDFFPVVPALAALQAQPSTQTIYKLSPTLRAPYIAQSAIAFERQLPFNITAAVTYANTHGLHILRSEVLPGNIFLMESSGLYNQHQLIVNVNAKVNGNVSLAGSYVKNSASSNTDGLGTFPAIPGNSSGEYGPASTDIHDRASLTGSIATKWNIRLSPLLTMESGPPFDITAGRDLYGTTLFNGRPGIATDPRKTGVVATNYGLLDPNPTPDEKLLPRNFGRGPGMVMFNLRVAKTFTFGTSREASSGPAIALPGDGRRQAGGVFSQGTMTPAAASTGRKYNLTVSMSMRNLLNHNNPGAIIGNITSPLFGRANQIYGSTGLGGTGFSEAANNRRLELQTRFTF